MSEDPEMEMDGYYDLGTVRKMSKFSGHQPVVPNFVELERQLAALRAKLAAAERERDEAQELFVKQNLRLGQAHAEAERLRLLFERWLDADDRARAFNTAAMCEADAAQKEIRATLATSTAGERWQAFMIAARELAATELGWMEWARRHKAFQDALAALEKGE